MEYSDSPVFITPGVCAVDIAFTIVKSIPSPFPCFFIQADIIRKKKERRQHFIYLFILTTGLVFRYICCKSLYFVPQLVLL